MISGCGALGSGQAEGRKKLGPSLGWALGCRGRKKKRKVSGEKREEERERDGKRHVESVREAKIQRQKGKGG